MPFIYHPNGLMSGDFPTTVEDLEDNIGELVRDWALFADGRPSILLAVTRKEKAAVVEDKAGWIHIRAPSQIQIFDINDPEYLKLNKEWHGRK